MKPIARALPLVLGLSLSPALAQSSTPCPGYTIVDPMANTTAYAFDATGATQLVWTLTERPGLAAYIDQGGNLLRGFKTGVVGVGFGGGVERVAVDGTSIWRYIPPLTGAQHHDIAEMPNGNVLMCITEDFTNAQVLALGADPATAPGTWTSEIVIEVKPTGPTTGDIVWMWRAFDHLVQDFDAGAPNFDLPSNRPERIDLNHAANTGSNLWLHMNGIDYNPELDQIVVSCRDWNEFWVIDHSTTTAQAAGSTGGNSGKGGDLLYRWGNPAAYGTPGTQQLSGQHDVNWIPPGRPGAGNFICFNNNKGQLLGLGNASAVTEIVSPVDGNGNYPLTPGMAYGPAAPVWEYFAPTPTDMYSNIVSGAQRLPNGNTLVTVGTQNRVLELGLGDAILWEEVVSQTFKARHFSELPSVTEPGVPFCYGVGCPCGNDDPTAGCVNSTGSGAELTAAGTRSVAADDLVLTTTGCPPLNSGLYFTGDTNFTGVFVGDGLGCVGGSSFRYFPGTVDATGTFVKTGIVATAPAGFITAGVTRSFQSWTRDVLCGPPPAPCPTPCGNGNNLSNGYAVTFLP